MHLNVVRVFAWALSLACGVAEAQFGGGLALGLNPSQINGDGHGGYYRAGLSVGGFVRYPLGQSVALQPEILVDQLGSGARGIGRIARITTVSVPVLLTAGLPITVGDATHRIEAQGGIIAGWLLGARDDLSGGMDFSESLDRLDFRWTAGGEYKLGRRVALCARYAYSLSSFVRSNAGPSPITVERIGLFHKYLTISLRWHWAGA